VNATANGTRKIGLHVEDQKNDRVEIILGAKLNLRLADRLNAAFVGRVLLRARLLAVEKICASTTPAPAAVMETPPPRPRK